MLVYNNTSSKKKIKATPLTITVDIVKSCSIEWFVCMFGMNSPQSQLTYPDLVQYPNST